MTPIYPWPHAAALLVAALVAVSAVAAAPRCVPPSDGGTPLPDVAPCPVPEPTARAQRRYIAPDGVDSADGRSPKTAWRTLGANLERIAPDTEIVFLDGVHRFARSVYRNDGPGFALPARVTLRADRYRGATLQGPTEPAAPTDGIAIALLGGDADLEIWGLVFDGWPGGGAGTVLLEGDNTGIRIVGNRFVDNGSTVHHHAIYLAGGPSATATQRDWLIDHNEAELPAGSGAFLHVYGGAHGARDGVVRHNLVTGDGTWGILQSNARPDGARSAVRVHDNTFVGAFSDGVVQFGAYADEPLNGVDASYRVERNHLENLAEGDGAYAIWRWPAVGGGKDPHAPTLRDNVMRVAHDGPAMAGFDDEPR